MTRMTRAIVVAFKNATRGPRSSTVGFLMRAHARCGRCGLRHATVRGWVSLLDRRLFLLRHQPHDSPAVAIRHHVERAVGTLAHVADARIELGEEPLFADHTLAVQHEPDEVFADERGDEEIALP